MTPGSVAVGENAHQPAVDFDSLGVDSGVDVLLTSAHGDLEGPVFRDAGVPVGSAVVPWLAPECPANGLINHEATVTDVRVERL